MHILGSIKIVSLIFLFVLTHVGGAAETGGIVPSSHESIVQSTDILQDGEVDQTSRLENDLRIIENASPAVVSIRGYKEMPLYRIHYTRGRSGRRYSMHVESEGWARQRISTGSGFFITKDGYIITNKHVVGDKDAEYTVDFTGEEIAATVLYRDPYADVAVIKIKGEEYPTLSFTNRSSLKVGETVIGIGNALGRFTDSVSSGTVAAVEQDIVIPGRDGALGERIVGLVESNARLYPGDSGGPLLNSKGEVVGVNVAIKVGTNISYSIPVSMVREVMERAALPL